MFKKVYSLYSAFCTQPAFYHQSAVCILHSQQQYIYLAIFDTRMGMVNGIGEQGIFNMGNL